jgi:hypothetical protein
MAKLYFMNHGAFNVRAMLTFGISAKEKDDAIGFFGTGFKYAVAIVLRLGGSIKVTTGGEQYVFSAKRETIRNQDFDIVFMNGSEAGFTTRLGIKWDPWMAFRELYCNCMDESGFVGYQPADYETVIEVRCDQISQAYENRADYFVTGKPCHSVTDCDIYDAPSQFYFYRGVAVRRMPYPAMWTYNIKSSVELTEDRTAKYEHHLTYPIQKATQSLSNEAMLRRVLTAKGEVFEAHTSYESCWPTSEQFVSVARQLIASGVGIRESARSLIKKLDDKAGNWPELTLTKVQQNMLERAKTLLKTMGVTASQFDIKVVDGLGDGVMGRALDGKIYLSGLPFNMGTKQVASTLLEEWVHNKYGCEDFDRQMQNWLFDKIVSLGEELQGEPV